MRIKSISLILSFAFLLACTKNGNLSSTGPCPLQNLSKQAPFTKVQNSYLVKLNDEVLLPAFSATYTIRQQELSNFYQGLLSSTFGITSQVESVYATVFKGFALDLSQTELARLRSSPLVDFIEVNSTTQKFQHCETAAFDLKNQQLSYGARRVGVKTGVGKRVWILDTGVDYMHPDLTVDSALSRNFVNNPLGIRNEKATDEDGHGTHVSGIIAAKNNNIGTLGISFGAQIIAVKVLNATGSGSASDLLSGLEYIVLNAKANEVVNVSLGSASNSLVNLAFENAAQGGLLFAIAAGNDSKNASAYSPASAQGANIYTLSAIDANDRFAFFSNFGNPPIEFAEPGVNINSTWIKGTYKTLSGTSMAAPHFAGILLNVGKNFKTSGTAQNDPDGSPDLIAVNQ